MAFKKIAFIILISTGFQKVSAGNIDTCLVGMYLKSIYDLSPANSSFNADMYIWSNSKSELGLFQQIEIINGKKIEPFTSFNGKDSGYNVNYENCKVQLSHNWDLKFYPFDKQYFKIILESQESLDYMYLTEDRNGFQMSRDLTIPGWKIKRHFIEKSFIEYPSDFGYHHFRLRDKRFNRLAFIIEAERESWGLYFKLFAGLYIAFLVSFLSFYIRPDHVDPRFGLSIGGLFASVANKYVVDANIPSTISFSFVDMVHFMTFFFIFLTIIVSSIALKRYSNNDFSGSRSLDKKMSKLILVFYLLLNIILIIFSIYQR